MPACITCQKELDSERAEKYEYCTDPECQKLNARGLEIVAVGVNKAADQYVLLDERTKREMAIGRFKKQPEVPASLRVQPRTQPRHRPKQGVGHADRSPATEPRQWSDAQENLALIYRRMGMKPDEIARKLGVSDHLVTKILLAATARGRR